MRIDYIYPTINKPMFWIWLAITLGLPMSEQPLKVTMNTIPIDGDSVKTFQIPPADKYVHFTSPQLEKWITSILVADEGSCDNPSALAFFNALDIPLITGLEKDVTATYYRSTFQPDLYYVGTTVPCDPYQKVVMLFIIHSGLKKLIRYDAYWGEGCLGDRHQYGGEFERFTKIGPYLAMASFYTNFGLESSSYYLLNENLIELGNLPQAIYLDHNNEDPKKNITMNRQYHYMYAGDTLIQHAIIEVTKGTNHTQRTFDVFYTCRQDTLFCISPGENKKMEAFIKRYW